MSRRLLLVRHGRTAWNAQSRYQGQADPPLDDLGRAQSYELALLVAELQPSVVWTSDLQRAVQTAEPIAQMAGVSVVLEPRLRERSLGHWEGLTRDEVADRYPDEYADWAAGRDVSRRGGESREQVAQRAVSVLDDLPDVPVAVLVTHSATAMALTSAMLGLPQGVHLMAPLANCHWSELRTTDESTGPAWRLRSHNVGAPGPVIPMVSRRTDEDEAADAGA